MWYTVYSSPTVPTNHCRYLSRYSLPLSEWSGENLNTKLSHLPNLCFTAVLSTQQWQPKWSDSGCCPWRHAVRLLIEWLGCLSVVLITSVNDIDWTLASADRWILFCFFKNTLGLFTALFFCNWFCSHIVCVPRWPPEPVVRCIASLAVGMWSQKIHLVFVHVTSVSDSKLRSFLIVMDLVCFLLGSIDG